MMRHQFGGSQALNEVDRPKEDTFIPATIKKGEMDKYIGKFKADLPKDVLRLLQLLDDYDIMTYEEVSNILHASKNDIEGLSDKYGISEDDMEEVWSTLKNLEAEDNKPRAIEKKLTLIPQLMSQDVFQSCLHGKLKPEDLKLNLDTDAGQDFAAKKYMKVLEYIVNSFVGHCHLSKDDLINAAYEGLTNAIAKWSPHPNKHGKVCGFKTFVGFCVRYAIEGEIDSNRAMGSTYLATKYGQGTTVPVSIDSWNGEEWDQSRNRALSDVDGSTNFGDDLKKAWKEVFDILTRRFDTRELEIFYKYYGLATHHNKPISLTDIAKEYGTSSSNILNKTIAKILKFLRSNRRLAWVLRELKVVHLENLMVKYWRYDKKAVSEKILGDDLYILLEELTPWTNKQVFKNAHNNAMKEFSDKDKKKLEDILKGDFITLDDNYKKENPLIKKYLSLMYPKVNVNRLSDVSALDYMEELQDAYKNLLK